MTDRDLCGKYRLGGARVCFGLTKRKKGLLKNSFFNCTFIYVGIAAESYFSTGI